MTSLHFSLPLPANLLSRTTPSRSSTHIMMNVRPLMPNCNLFFSPRDASLVETVCGGRTSYDGRCYKEALCWPHFPHGHQFQFDSSNHRQYIPNQKNKNLKEYQFQFGKSNHGQYQH